MYKTLLQKSGFEKAGIKVLHDLQNTKKICVSAGYIVIID